MKRNWLMLYIALVVILLGVGIYFLKTSKGASLHLLTFTTPPISPTQAPIPASGSGELVTVKRVVDGDTIELADGRKVRYIGVDTPELHHPTKGVQCFGKEAMEVNKKLVEGKIISMKKDISETDRYKRLLRYIWVGNIFVNDYLVREGYANQATFPPDVKYVELFKKSAEQARVENKGLWKLCK